MLLLNRIKKLMTGTDLWGSRVESSIGFLWTWAAYWQQVCDV